MLTATEDPGMAKKKSETRKHTAMMRVDREALELAKLAASMMKMTLADYMTDMIKKNAGRDVDREANKLAKRSKEHKE